MIDTLEIAGKAAPIYQERLFSRLVLHQVLDLIEMRAIDELEREKGAGKDELLVERLLERHALEPLKISRKVEWVGSFTFPHGETEHLFSAGFSGAPLLWHLSPSPLQDVLPEGYDLTMWYLDPGETLQRPYGEVFRDRLLIGRESRSAAIEAIAEIGSLIERQGEIITSRAESLETELWKLSSAVQTRH